MMKKRNPFKALAALLAAILLLSVLGVASAEVTWEKWSENAPAVAALTEYMQKITDEASPAYIPVERRIAVFDFDGTLFCELFPAYVEWLMFLDRVNNDESYAPSEDVIAFAAMLQSQIDAGNKWQDDTELLEALYGAQAFAGMTTEEYHDYVVEFMEKPAEGFTNLARKDAYYQPMLEIIDYLAENDFTVYVVSGSDRNMLRAIMEDKQDVILPAHVIGMDILMEATNQNGEDGLEYVYDRENDEVVRSDKLVIKNVKMNKVSQMAQEIYVQPVLAFGNSTGDESMLEYVLDENPYESMAFFVIADDTVREYGNEEKSKASYEKCEEKGWVPISMANDFVTIYGEDVEITGK